MHKSPIVVDGISKSYPVGKEKVNAVTNISFIVNPGEIFGLIGPDGAGKTSLFRILTTLLIPDNGNAYVEGFNTVNDYHEIRKIVGYMPGRFSLYQDLSVEENLSFFATLFNTSLEENYDLVKDIYNQIEPFKKRRAGKLSGGMKQKLALCCALIHRPHVLFLDEPTTGVDAVSRTEFWTLLRKLQDQSITMMVSTPYMDEASLCDRVALIQNGNILDIDTPKEITNKFENPLWAFRSDQMYKLLLDLQQMDNVIACYPFGQHHHVVLHQDQDVPEILDQLKAKGQTNLKAEPGIVTIEDCFMQQMRK
ncbi:MAG: ABC transporter ATP-binding protein [Flammeovirgaceae bacterium]|nr:ABC transporter ATP-binding protein [Flammeovirgaceae bacterium]